MENLDMGKRKGSKPSLISKTWQRCRSISGSRRPSSKTSFHPSVPMTKSKSWPRTDDLIDEKYRFKHRVAPEGCFSVYVGPEKERFVIKTELANHPLFKELLEEAEMEYGFNSEGPLALPCPVDLFHRVLSEMDTGKTYQGCNFAKGYTSYQPISSPRNCA